MHKIRVDQAMGDKAVVLSSPGYCRGIKDQVINYFLLIEGADGNDAGDDKDDQGDT